MWVVTRVLRAPDTLVEAAIAELVEEEIAGCETCKGMYESCGALPTHCKACGRVRNSAWERWIDEQACHLVQARKGA